jgi:hypothetical protein
MPQWEYRKINLNDVPRKTDDVDLLNVAGEQGWELFGVTANNVVSQAPSVGATTTTKGALQSGNLDR